MRQVTTPAWMRRALCLTGIRLGLMKPDDWYPDWGQKTSPRTQLAIRVCQACPVRRQCLAWAVATGEQHGIWGGKMYDELTRIRNERKKTAVAVAEPAEPAA